VTEAFPTVSISQYRLELDQNKATFQSSFTRQRQTVPVAGGIGDRWAGFVKTRPLKNPQALTAMNFLMKVGVYGRFTMLHPNYSGAASGESIGLVKGAGQSGKSLLIDGFTPSTLILQAGEWFQVRDEFKRVTANATSNGAGEITVFFEPTLRVSPADNDPVDLSSPVLLCELMMMPSQDTDFRRLTTFTIPFQEALVHE
jgi:hypothetical protein